MNSDRHPGPKPYSPGTVQPTRRRFLGTSLTGAAGIALSVSGFHQTAKSDERTAIQPDDGAIDAHVHVWTPDLDRYPLAAGFANKNMQPRSFTAEELLTHMKAAGVARVVLIQMNFYGFDNAYMLDVMKDYPGVFSGVAVIDQHGKDPAGEMRRLKQLGVRGFRILPDISGSRTWLDGDSMRAMWQCAAEEGLAMCHLIDAEDLPATDRMCDKNPDTPVVIDHFARIGHDGTFNAQELKNLCNLARFKNTYLKLSAFYYLGAKRPPYTDLAPMIRQVLDAFGPERLMWATDAPFQVDPPHTYRASIELIRDHLDFLTARDKEWLLKKTAQRVFFS